MLTLTDLHRVCGPADGPQLAGTLLVVGMPRQPLDLQVDGPAGTLLGSMQLPPVEGTTELAVELDLLKTLGPAPAGAWPEWNVRVSEGEQILTQEVADPRPGPTCG